MKSYDPDLMNSYSNLTDSDRGPHFSFNGLVESEPITQGNSVPNAKLIDNSPFESTEYTDSINRVSNLVRKFETPKSRPTAKLNIMNPVLSDGTPDKPMETDANTDPNQKEQDLYANTEYIAGSIDVAGPSSDVAGPSSDSRQRTSAIVVDTL